MKISATIAAHPHRRAAAEHVQSRLERAVPIVFDEVPEPSSDPVQRWITHQRAWESAYAASEGEGGVMVVQDDVLVATDLLAGLEQALDLFPEEDDQPEFLISAYNGTNNGHRPHIRRACSLAQRRGETWFATRSLNWGPAVLVPAWTIPNMLDAVDEHIRSKRPPYSNTDYAIGVYYRDVLGWATHYTIPSLVEHAGLPSLVGHDVGPPRKAYRFIGEDASALSVPWNRIPRGGLRTRLADFRTRASIQ